MATELLHKFRLRRGTLEACGQSWESYPIESIADASHRGIRFNAPQTKDWLNQLADLPEEEAMTQALADRLLADRGHRPYHAPVSNTNDNVAEESNALMPVCSHGLCRHVFDLPFYCDECGRIRQAGESAYGCMLCDYDQCQDCHQIKVKIDARRTKASVEALWRTLEVEHRALGLERAALKATEAKLRRREEKAKRQGLINAGAMEYPRPQWFEGYDGTINIAVTGNSGVGKSLLINRLRRVQRQDTAWASVGVEETTLHPTMYTFPGDDRIRLWDLPGAGTAKFPCENYIQTMGLRYFDSVLIVTASRFTSMEVKLKKELEKQHVPYFMVRTKVDIDIVNNMEDNQVDEIQTLEQLAEDYRNNGISKAYLVSLRDPTRFEMASLMEALFPGILPKMSPSIGRSKAAAGWDDAWAICPAPAYGC